jgi:hypothetical protein
MTAISAVPPPMSMMRLPDGPEIGMFAPIAAASGSSMRCASRAPATLDAGHAGWDADHELGLEDPDLTADLVDEVPEHVFGDDVVGDHAVAHRSERGDRSRRAAQHEPRLLADRDDPRPVRTVLLREGDDRRLGEHDPLPTDVDDDIGGAEVDADLAGEHAVNSNGRNDRKVRYVVTRLRL